MTTNLRLGNLLAILFAGAGLAACTPPAATTGTGGSGGAATGTGGTSSTGGAGGANANGIVCEPAGTTTDLTASAGIACPKPAASGLITDFTFPADAGVPDGGAPPRFGDDSTVLSGGGSTFANTPGSITLSDSSGGDWHIKGNVANYAGFSLYFDDILNAAEGNMPCNMVDATGFTGISFKIWGTTAGNGITMSMGIVDDSPTASWFQSIGVTLTPPLPAGACIPNSGGMQYYHPGCGDPTAPAITIPSTATSAATAQTVTFKWTDFVNGACMPNVIPSQIVSVAWAFAWSTMPPTSPYDVDIHLDDLTFTTN
ncbi:MAG TPA: hypothetical protein VHO06_11245 [Polyangia bacterium]|nr:hypothetical protein [Polyangia bacterium]